VYPPPAAPISYPFNLILTSATIPNALNNYLKNYHPSLIRLSSPDLHHLPRTLETEYVAWSGGNKFADIHRRIRRIWAEDAASAPDRRGALSKVLIFCNKSTKVIELCAYLEEQDVKCVPMTSAGEHRRMGSNRHLAGFMKKQSIVETVSKTKGLRSLRRAPEIETRSPLVMVTTSLLSRGLDFSPEVKHVFIVDEPRNMVDFLHRAGRSGRAGQRGKVVVFGKLSGRGSERGKEVRKRVVGLKARSKVASAT
jgi:ATP-dependent RNA helicase MRH4